MLSLKDETRRISVRSKQFLDVWISAPTLIKEKEFLFSALARLAVSVGHNLTDNKSFPNRPPEDELRALERQRRITIVVWVASVVAAVAAVASLVVVNARAVID